MKVTMRPPSVNHPCLSGGGTAGAVLRARDWSETPLGPVESWPASLCTVLGLVLNSKFPMFLAWGPELVFLYNDAYAEIIGNKHPAAQGARFPDIWKEIWSDIEPIVGQAMDGKATFHENASFSVFRNGRYETAWFVLSYSPLLGADNDVGGLFCVCAETTALVVAARDRNDENRRLRRLFHEAPGVIAHLVGPHHVYDLVTDAYAKLVGKSALVGLPARQALPELAGQGLFELLDQAYATGKPCSANAMPLKREMGDPGRPDERLVSFKFQPTFDERGNVSGIFVEGADVTEAAPAAVRETAGQSMGA